MSSTYFVMSVPFLAWAALLVAVARWKFGLRLRSLAAPIAAVVALTVVFDNLIIAAGLVAYDPSRNLGIMIGLAPIEDFLYAVVAVCLSASLWAIMTPRRTS